MWFSRRMEFPEIWFSRRSALRGTPTHFAKMANAAGSRRMLQGLGSALAVGLLFGSGALDAEIGARKDPFGIRCHTKDRFPSRACKVFLGLPVPLPRKDTHFCAEMACVHGPHACRLSQLQLNLLSKVWVAVCSVYFARPSPRGLLALILALFLAQAPPSPDTSPTPSAAICNSREVGELVRQESRQHRSICSVTPKLGQRSAGIAGSQAV